MLSTKVHDIKLAGSYKTLVQSILKIHLYATAIGTKVKIVPVKAHNSVGIVERYYRPIC
jgi:hypothetical protein